MELKNLKDFYEKQTYYTYEETKKQTEQAKALSELTFFVNVAVFAVLLVIFSYVTLSTMNTLTALPTAIVLTFATYLASKKAIKLALAKLLK